MTRLFLQHKTQADLWWEVISFDKATHVAVLRGPKGTMTDPNFHIEIVRRLFTLTQEPPWTQPPSLPLWNSTASDPAVSHRSGPPTG